MRHQTKGKKRRVDKRTKKKTIQWLREQKEIVVDTTKIPSAFRIWLERREGGDWTDATEYALVSDPTLKGWACG